MYPPKASNQSRMIPVQHEPSVSILVFIAALGWNPQAASLSVKLEVRSASGPSRHLRAAGRSPPTAPTTVVKVPICVHRVGTSSCSLPSPDVNEWIWYTRVSSSSWKGRGACGEWWWCVYVHARASVCVCVCVCVWLCVSWWNEILVNFSDFFHLHQTILLFLILLSWGWRPVASLNMMLYYDCCSYDFHSLTEAHAAFGLHSQGIPAHDYEEQGLQNHIRKSCHSEPAYYPSFSDTCWAPTTCQLCKFSSRFCVVTWVTADTEGNATRGPRWGRGSWRKGN